MLNLPESFWGRPPETVAQQLESYVHGLATAEVKRRFAKFVLNGLNVKKRSGYFYCLRSNLTARQSASFCWQRRWRSFS